MKGKQVVATESPETSSLFPRWLLIILGIALFTGVVITFAAILGAFGPLKHHKTKPPVQGEHTCGALDPVMNPVYNMKEIVKQSILLEEHINNERKRCIDCITKHFLHIIGLAEEAISLDPDTASYRTYAQSYRTVFQMWQTNREDTEVPKRLRVIRKQLMGEYFLRSTDGSCSMS